MEGTSLDVFNIDGASSSAFGRRQGGSQPLVDSAQAGQGKPSHSAQYKSIGSCPSACRTCKSGGRVGTRLGISGVCEHYCSKRGYCGASLPYRYTACGGCRLNPVDEDAAFWSRIAAQTREVAPGQPFHISTTDCRELRTASQTAQVIPVFALSRSAASFLAGEIAQEVGAQYLDELFNEAAPLHKYLNGKVVVKTRRQPAAFLTELIRTFRRPIVFKVNSPDQIPLHALAGLARCTNWCPVVLERTNIRDRWCSDVRAQMTGYWGRRQKGRKELPCPDVYKRWSFESTRQTHLAWYDTLRRVLKGTSIYTTFDQATKETVKTRKEVREFCSRHVQKISP